jgi:hypothetical protein
MSRTVTANEQINDIIADHPDTAIHVILDTFQRLGGGFPAGMMGGGLRGGIVGGGFRSATVAGASAASVCVVGSSGPAASRCAQDLHHPLLVSIDSVIAASPSRRCHSRSGLASMAARVGLGNQPPGAGSGFGPVTTTTGTTDTTNTNPQ